MDITVVAPTYQRAGRLRRLLAALEAQDLPHDRFEVVVVDDASTDETAALLRQAEADSPLQLRAVVQTCNGGPAVGRNAGWRLARGPVVAFIDDDCVPSPGWARAFLEAFARNEHLGVAQGRTSAPDGPRGPWTIAREITDETPWFEGCNIAYRRDALAVTGGFDEEIGWYGEDTSAGWRVLDAGWERDFVPAAAVEHDLEERSVRWRVRHAWLERNLVALAARHPGLRGSGFARPWVFRTESVTFPLAIAGLVGGRRHVLLAGLAIPYLLARRSLLRRPVDLAAFAVVDLAAIAGHLRGSLAHRTVVL